MNNEFGEITHKDSTSANWIANILKSSSESANLTLIMIFKLKLIATISDIDLLSDLSVFLFFNTSPSNLGIFFQAHEIFWIIAVFNYYFLICVLNKSNQKKNENFEIYSVGLVRIPFKTNEFQMCGIY